MQPDTPHPGPHRPRRILLAEDSPAVQEIVRAFLIHSGFHVDVVATGDAAVDALRTARYDLVLMDIEMPVMSGLSATRAIRRLPAPAGATPIMALTANADAENRGACRDAGMNDFLAKPVRRGPLVERVNSWVAGPLTDFP
ncbi:MAG: response regulator [Alphaproteobacteria bacterium]|jgi:CheY-like chemotaxis protein|nr:response regulator [Alphaproteobacteria bacterium]